MRRYTVRYAFPSSKPLKTEFGFTLNHCTIWCEWRRFTRITTKMKRDRASHFFFQLFSLKLFIVRLILLRGGKLYTDYYIQAMENILVSFLWKILELQVAINEMNKFPKYTVSYKCDMSAWPFRWPKRVKLKMKKKKPRLFDWHIEIT